MVEQIYRDLQIKAKFNQETKTKIEKATNNSETKQKPATGRNCVFYYL